jgi:RHS repeat-associated protein
MIYRTFTGKERDAETGLDYFGARYFSSAQGRWTSPDWSTVPQPVPYADLTDPQTLNLYSYVRNNPLSRTDPDGHCSGFLDCVYDVGKVVGVGISAGASAASGAAVAIFGGFAAGVATYRGGPIPNISGRTVWRRC